MRATAHERDARCIAGFGECRILRKKSVARVKASAFAAAPHQ